MIKGEQADQRSSNQALVFFGFAVGVFVCALLYFFLIFWS